MKVQPTLILNWVSTLMVRSSGHWRRHANLTVNSKRFLYNAAVIRLTGRLQSPVETTTLIVACLGLGNQATRDGRANGPTISDLTRVFSVQGIFERRLILRKVDICLRNIYLFRSFSMGIFQACLTSTLFRVQARLINRRVFYFGWEYDIYLGY